MRRWIMGIALLPAALRADEPDRSYLRPSISLHAVQEQTSGEAFGPPNDASSGLAASVGLGLDARGRLPGGFLQASTYAFALDPLESERRGLFVAGRARGLTSLGSGWRLRIDDSARLQRRDDGALADFERNEILLGLEHDLRSGWAVGLRGGDRRRSVTADPAQGFALQSALASVIWGRLAHQVRVEVGPQRFSADTARGWRLSGSGELAGRVASWTGAVRVTWLEPLQHREGAASVDSAAAPQPTMGLPSKGATSALAPESVPPTGTLPANDATSTAAPAPLLGPSLIVDPLEDDEGDWSFGRRKQEIVALASRPLGWRLTATAELRAEIDRGPDLLGAASGGTEGSTTSADVRRERLAARVHLRRDLGTRWAVLAQGGLQRLSDRRPGLSYVRGVVFVGIELRP